MALYEAEIVVRKTIEADSALEAARLFSTRYAVVFEADDGRLLTADTVSVLFEELEED